MPALNTAQQNALEQLVDSNGLGHVLEALSIICGEKGEHIAANYAVSRNKFDADTKLAKQWATVGNYLGNVAYHARVEAVTPR